MERLFDIAIPIALLAVLVTLIVGVLSMLRGGELGRRNSIKLMRLRVALQFVAVVIIAAAFFFRARHG
ncbi:MAG: twin transmembrane helix small protein [Caulobacteraceae bacterium]